MSHVTEEADDRDNRRGDDDPVVCQRERKAIVGVEARRGIRDEKAVEPTRNKRRSERRRWAARRRSPEAAGRKMAAVVAAGKTSKDGNDDSRPREERRKEGEEERKTTTNESLELHGKKPSEGSREARREERRLRTPPNRWHSEAVAVEQIDAVVAVVAGADSDDGDGKNESSKTLRYRCHHYLRLLRLINWRSSFVLQSSRKKIRCNERRTD